MFPLHPEAIGLPRTYVLDLHFNFFCLVCNKVLIQTWLYFILWVYLLGIKIMFSTFLEASHILCSWWNLNEYKVQMAGVYGQVT